MTPASEARTLDTHRREIAEILGPVFARRAARTDHFALTDPEVIGRVAAQRYTAIEDVPPFSNSQMDGFAVRAADVTADPMPVGTAAAAGDAPFSLQPGHAHPVMTGAALPRGADAVIPIEEALPPRFPPLQRSPRSPSDSTPHGPSGPSATVSFRAAPTVGRYVRERGSDAPYGATLIDAGERLTPARLGVLAACGIGRVAVRARLRVLLITTGDELVMPGQHRAPGQIFDANATLLSAALRQAGAEVTMARATDDSDAFAALLVEAAPRYDLVVTSGGISAGAFEVVREAGVALGVEFARLALQPGGPQGWGRIGSNEADATPIVCLPGNPVSSSLSLELFVLPHVRAHAGSLAERPVTRRPLAHPVTSPGHLHQVRRGRLDPEGRVTLFAPSSHLLFDLAQATVLAHLPVGVSQLDTNDPVTVWSIDD